MFRLTFAVFILSLVALSIANPRSSTSLQSIENRRPDQQCIGAIELMTPSGTRRIEK